MSPPPSLTEVGEFEVPAPAEQEVLGLEVAVQHLVPVAESQTPEQLEEEKLPPPQPTAPQNGPLHTCRTLVARLSRAPSRDCGPPRAVAALLSRPKAFASLEMAELLIGLFARPSHARCTPIAQPLTQSKPPCTCKTTS